MYNIAYVIAKGLKYGYYHHDDVMQISTLNLAGGKEFHKAGQTKFTVHRHKILYFACGWAVIILISY